MWQRTEARDDARRAPATDRAIAGVGVGEDRASPGRAGRRRPGPDLIDRNEERPDRVHVGGSAGRGDARLRQDEESIGAGLVGLWCRVGPAARRHPREIFVAAGERGELVARGGALVLLVVRLSRRDDRHADVARAVRDDEDQHRRAARRRRRAGLGRAAVLRVALEEPGLDRLQHQRRRSARGQLSLHEVAADACGDHASVVGEEKPERAGRCRHRARS